MKKRGKAKVGPTENRTVRGMAAAKAGTMKQKSGSAKLGVHGHPSGVKAHRRSSY